MTDLKRQTILFIIVVFIRSLIFFVDNQFYTTSQTEVGGLTVDAPTLDRLQTGSIGTMLDEPSLYGIGAAQ